ncbi:hypothetical protein LCGC14_2253450 [marine sediment metagenome]|uniref:Uncharacterized protein n=1 Tax=marine sediment metagenome TaxID=412755 RepID=A0A0F9D257_9ZZZZ
MSTTSPVDSIVDRSSPFNKSDEVIKASFTTEVNANPTIETGAKLVAAHGKGLSTVDFNALYKSWQDKLGKDETPQESAIKRAYTIFNAAKTDNVFDSDEAKNSVEWARTVETLDVFVSENPNLKPKEYTDFAEQTLIEVKRGFLGSAWDLIRHPVLFKRELGASEGEAKSRRMAIGALRAAGQEITEKNIIDAVNQLEDAGEL